MSIGKPTADWHSMLGVEDIGGWRVVDDDRLSEISADLGKILDVISLVIITTFSEQTMMDNVVDVQLI